MHIDAILRDIAHRAMHDGRATITVKRTEYRQEYVYGYYGSAGIELTYLLKWRQSTHARWREDKRSTTFSETDLRKMIDTLTVNDLK